MTVIGILITMGIAAMCSGFAYNIIDYCIDRQKKKDCEKLDKHEDYIIRGHIDYNNNMNKQIVYKVDGDFNGNIKGDNVTIILMGDGDFNGNIESKDGEVVLIKGDINGNVKADKVVCPTPPIKKTCELCRYYVNGGVNHYWCTQGDIIRRCIKCEHYEDKISDNTAKHNPAKDVESPKLPVKTLWSCDIPQGTSPKKRTDHYTSIGNWVSIYGSSPVTHITNMPTL